MSDSSTTDEKVVDITEKEQENDDEPDDWDKRINNTGCAAEQTKMNDCYFEKKDWRECKEEMELFRQCWKVHSNDQRTETIDVEKPAEAKDKK